MPGDIAKPVQIAKGRRRKITDRYAQRCMLFKACGSAAGDSRFLRKCRLNKLDASEIVDLDQMVSRLAALEWDSAGPKQPN